MTETCICLTSQSMSLACMAGSPNMVAPKASKVHTSCGGRPSAEASVAEAAASPMPPSRTSSAARVVSWVAIAAPAVVSSGTRSVEPSSTSVHAPSALLGIACTRPLWEG